MEKINERNQQAVETAKRNGYFTRLPYPQMSYKAYNAWVSWCKKHGHPNISIKPHRSGGKLKHVSFNGDPIYDYAFMSGYIPYAPDLAPTPELMERVKALAMRYLVKRPSSHASWSTGHIHVWGVSAEQAILIAREIVEIWNIAKEHPNNLLETHSMENVRREMKRITLDDRYDHC